MMPGAYIRATFTGTSTISLLVDGEANLDCPPASSPMIEYSLDHGAYETVALTRRISDSVPVAIADNLSPDLAHEVEIVLRAADLTQHRWTKPDAHLRVAGFQIDATGSVLPTTTRPKRAIAFGDSITEGVGAAALFKSWQSLEANSARVAWFPLLATALDCEYGQLASGGQGMCREFEMPALPKTWDRYDATSSRLEHGRLLPEPDFVFCAMGTNDFEIDIEEEYSCWLESVRKACPQSLIYCVVPPLGVHRDEIARAVQARKSAGDDKVFLIDIGGLQSQFATRQRATPLAHDGVHPTEHGHGMLAALIAAKVACSD
jgi:lysophospholipase L1-like esterase